MSRIIDQGQIELTRVRGYRWLVGLDGSGNPVVQEQYTVTDEEYTAAPEGQKNLDVALTNAETTALRTAMRKHLKAAAVREQVIPEIDLP